MRHILTAFLLLSLVACSSTPTKEDKSVSADELYAQAKEAMDDHSWDRAVKRLETLQSRYPYGRYAQQAYMEIAYAYFKQGEPAPAIASLDRFAKQFPNSEYLDYSYYLKGLIHFNENINSISSTLFSQSPAERDPVVLRESFNAFKELVVRYPNSKYAPDARERMKFLLVTLAQHEIHIASYYLRRGAYVAAVNRAQTVLTDYPQTPQTRDALQIMVQAYSKLGLEDLKKDTQRILDTNIAKDGIKPSQSYFKERETPWWKFWEI
ncbi:MAG: outer membrane protein assembly factor BamD [Sideroxydans sp.]|nr:outer membrane protein assembly factor BamD [Sideroxydans sp.]